MLQLGMPLGPVRGAPSPKSYQEDPCCYGFHYVKTSLPVSGNLGFESARLCGSVGCLTRLENVEDNVEENEQNTDNKKRPRRKRKQHNKVLSMCYINLYIYTYIVLYLFLYMYTYMYMVYIYTYMYTHVLYLCLALFVVSHPWPWIVLALIRHCMEDNDCRSTFANQEPAPDICSSSGHLQRQAARTCIPYPPPCSGS